MKKIKKSNKLNVVVHDGSPSEDSELSIFDLLKNSERRAVTENCFKMENILKWINNIYKERKPDIYRQQFKNDISQSVASTLFEYPEPPWDEDFLLDTVKFNPWHSVCIDVLAEDSVRPGFQLNNSGLVLPENINPENKLFLYNFFSRSNKKKQAIDDVLAMMNRNYLPLARCCAEPARNYNREITSIYFVNAYRIRPHRLAFIPNSPNPIFRYMIDWNKYKYYKQFGEKRNFDIDTGLPTNETNPDRLAKELIYMVKYESSLSEGVNPYYPYYGLSPLISLFLGTEGWKKQRIYNVTFFDSSIKNVFSAMGVKLDKKTNKMIEKWLSCEISGEELKNIFLSSADPDAKIDIKQLFDRAIEASFLEFNKQTRDEIIAAGWKVNPYRIGIMETGKLAGNLADNANKTYKDTALSPIQRMHENWINLYLIADEMGFNIQDWVIEFNPLDTADPTFKLNMSKALFDRGAINYGQMCEINGLQFLGTPEEAKMRAILSTYVPYDLWRTGSTYNKSPTITDANMTKPGTEGITHRTNDEGLIN